MNLATVVKSQAALNSTLRHRWFCTKRLRSYKAPGGPIGHVQSDVLAFISKIQTDAAGQGPGKTRMVFPLYN